MTEPMTEPMRLRSSSPTPSRRTVRAAASAIVVALLAVAPGCATGPPVEAGASADLSDSAKDPDGPWRTSTTPPPPPTIADFPGCAESSRYTVGAGAISLATDENREAAFDALGQLAGDFSTAVPELAERIEIDMNYLRRLAEEPDTISPDELQSAQANTFVLSTWWQDHCVAEPEDPGTTEAPSGSTRRR